MSFLLKIFPWALRVTSTGGLGFTLTGALVSVILGLLTYTYGMNKYDRYIEAKQTAKQVVVDRKLSREIKNNESMQRARKLRDEHYESKIREIDNDRIPDDLIR